MTAKIVIILLNTKQKQIFFKRYCVLPYGRGLMAEG